MKDLKISSDEQQRRLLQEYIFNLEDAKDHAAELAVIHENLKQYQDLLIAILSCTIHGLCLIKDRTIIWCNSPVADILGWKQEELIGQSVKLFYPSDSEYERMGEFIYGTFPKTNIKTFEYDFLHQDGHRVPCLITGRPLDPHNLSKGCVFSVTDFTERRQSREALQQACDALENRSVELMSANRQLLREIEEREAAQQELNDYRDHLEDLVKERTAELTAVNARLRREMAARQRIEEELLRTQKLESLGILAGGLAHDFNNILTAVIGNISLVKVSESLEEIHQRFEEMEKACFRARDLTQQLLTFAKGGLPVKETASISELIHECTVFTLRGSNVQAEFSLPENLWPVEVDAGQITQVINNLIINANQAMPGGGIVRISAENVKVKATAALPLHAGRYLKLSITDQGAGIGKEDLPKIFDPYFTTKPEGSGLGLTTAYSIIKKHDGHIAVASELGAGTTFHLYLPASDRKPVRQPRQDLEIIPGKGKILVMDDEEAVRLVLDKMLVNLGYEVEFAEDGAQAIELFTSRRASGDGFAAVILDLTIPGGMGGAAVLEHLLQIDPGVKAIVSSGYFEDPIMAQFEQHGFRGVIAKPYKISELSKIIHRVISE